MAALKLSFCVVVIYSTVASLLGGWGGKALTLSAGSLEFE